MAKFTFIRPSDPVEAPAPPLTDAYLYEVKWDGFRCQLQKRASDVTIFSRNGKYLPRFQLMHDPISRLPAKSLVIDAELVALNAKGMPDFRSLMGGQSQALVCFCFDLMELNGKDLRSLPLIKRRESLQRLLVKADIPELQYSESHGNPLELLARLDENSMEGIASKLKAQPYVSSKNRGWIKTKCHAWRKNNAERHKLFDK